MMLVRWTTNDVYIIKKGVLHSGLSRALWFTTVTRINIITITAVSHWDRALIWAIVVPKELYI